MAKAIIVQRREELSQRQSTGMAGRLEQVVLKGFDRIGEYLDMDAADENSEIRRHQSELASSLIRTQARLDDSIMQAQKDDRFLTVLEELARVEALPVPGKKG